jgi:hypothetical protein
MQGTALQQFSDKLDKHSARFGALRSVTMNSNIYWGVTLCIVLNMKTSIRLHGVTFQKTLLLIEAFHEYMYVCIMGGP